VLPPYGPADPTAAHCLLLQEIQIGFGFTFLVPALPGSPRQKPESRKMVVVVVPPRTTTLYYMVIWNLDPSVVRKTFPEDGS